MTNQPLAADVRAAITDDNLNPDTPEDMGVKHKHLCSRFVRCAARKHYGQKYAGLFGGTAIATGENMRDAGFTTSDDPTPGSFLIKMVGSGGAGHIGVYVGDVPGVGDGLVAENSSTAIGRVSGAKGYRTLDEFGSYDLCANLPALEVPEQAYRCFLNERFLGAMPLVGGHAYLRAALWAQALGLELDWDEDTQQVTFDGEFLPAVPRMFTRNGHSFVAIGDLVKMAGLQLSVDDAKAKVTVTR